MFFRQVILKSSDKFIMKILLLIPFLIGHVAAQSVEETEFQKALRLSCNKHKIGLSCFNYANNLAREDKADEAQKYFELGCQLKHEASCQQERWDIPERIKTANDTIAPRSPAPASIEESEPMDLSLDTPSDINQ